MKKKMLRLAARFSIAACLMMALCLSAFAEGETQAATTDISGVTSAITSGITGVVPAILTAVGALAAAGLGLFAAQFAVKAGIRMFKRVTNA